MSQNHHVFDEACLPNIGVRWESDANGRFLGIAVLVTEETGDRIYLRGTEETCHHSLTLTTATGEASCARVGFRVLTDADLDRAKQHFDGLGQSAQWIGVPHQSRTLLISDAAGTPIELCSA